MSFDNCHTNPSAGEIVQGIGFNSTINQTSRNISLSTSSTELSDERIFKNDGYVRPGETKIRKNFFPHKLMQILSSADYEDCISWREDGKAFYFVDREKFIKKISSDNPKNKEYKNKSFTRKLNRWGFRMHGKKGPDHGMYSHILFQRDKPWLCTMMVAEKSNDHQETESSSLDETTWELQRKRQSSHECTIGSENETFDQSMKRRRISDGLQAPLSINDMLNNLLEIDRNLALIEYLIKEKIRSMKSDPSLYNRTCEILRLFNFQTDEMSGDR